MAALQLQLKRCFGTVLVVLMRGSYDAFLREVIARQVAESVRTHGGVLYSSTHHELTFTFNVPNPLPVAGYLAVQAALEIQRFGDLCRGERARNVMHVAIGVHQGGMLYEAHGSSEYALSGPAFVAAHQLARRAAPGEVLISETVYDDIRHTSAQQRVSDRFYVTLNTTTLPQVIYRLTSDAA